MGKPVIDRRKGMRPANTILRDALAKCITVMDGSTYCIGHLTVPSLMRRLETINLIAREAVEAADRLQQPTQPAIRLAPVKKKVDRNASF